jgi:glucokinase
MIMGLLGGIDIGGTKCAVAIAAYNESDVTLLDKMQFPTPPTPKEALQQLTEGLKRLLDRHPGRPLEAIGISCGGPLDSRRGLILSPPNLPHWDGVNCIAPFKERFGVPVALQNDANACALAEWKWGAGKGSRSMVFLTFGTGMGAGLILDGRLYTGANDMAGEVGHIRLDEDGPVGYGKAGSFEGYCSGGGIARLARRKAEQALAEGQSPAFCPTEQQLPHITAKTVGEAAERGDPVALDIYRTVGRMLGRGLAVLVDVLNPEVIVIGGIYYRQQAILQPVMEEALRQEALADSLKRCRVVPAGLGEQVGDFASLSVAMNALKDGE